jgi:flagellar FliJ protein
VGKKTDEIKTLIRVQSWTVDEQRRVLSQLQGREDSLIEDCSRLDRQLLHEQQVATADPTMAGQAYVAYARNNRVQHANLKTVLAALRVEIEQQREVLAESYRELKTLEEVEKKWVEVERKEAARREQADLDEIAQNLHRRQQALELS